MNAIAWIAGSDQDDDLHLGRWAAAVAFVLAAHVGIAAAFMYVTPEAGITGADVPALMIDFAPEAAAPETEADLAPGPETFDSQASLLQPKVKEQAADEPVIELPPVPAPEPDLVLPPKTEEVVEKQEVPQP
jgi:hypothetical protein